MCSSNEVIYLLYTGCLQLKKTFSSSYKTLLEILYFLLYLRLAQLQNNVWFLAHKRKTGVSRIFSSGAESCENTQGGGAEYLIIA